jgi:hypothetical protein
MKDGLFLDSMMIWLAVTTRPRMSGIKERRMVTDTAMAAQESATAGDTESKLKAIPAATKTAALRMVSAQMCWKKLTK